jgi:peroxin-5
MEDKDLGEAWRELFQMAGEEGELSAFENAWQNSLDKPSVYEFQAENKFLEESDPMAEALRLIREGRDREAILALEAEVQKHVDSSEGWRLMGQLYADLDQDVEAIQCLRKGHEADPYNLDSLLALGVSCVNELDQLPALRYMRQWIENHEDHNSLVQGLEPPAAYDFEAWRQQVTALFNQAAARSPHDCDVFVALGVMENINRNYDGAVKALATACRLRPNDRTCWNKLGATLANSGQSEKAVTAYHQGLQLKPNYARSWSNLAIAHTNLNQHADAARFYLSALRLNPDATHLWSHVSSSVHRMDGGDDPSRLEALLPAIGNRDVSACSQMVDGVLDPNTLPKPQEALSVSADETLASINL